MTDDIKRIIIVGASLIVILLLVILAFFVDIDLKLIKFNSIKSLLSKQNEIEEKESSLLAKQNEYNVAVKKVEDAEKTFDSEKAKYSAITDKTIEIIKEATTEENYNIEYMWIRLGNYAKTNNLKIIMAEPGGSFEDDTTSGNSANKDGSTTSNSTKTTTTSTATTDSTTTSTTASTDSSTNATDAGKDSLASSDANTNNTNNANNTNNTNQNTSTDNTSSNTLFKIQVTGSYLNVADFVFEVENDNALRFKLDNISMDYVSGTTIKASFNVKGLVFNVQ